MTADSFERQQPDEAVGEWETLTQRLDFLRVTVAQKAHGLTDEQAFSTPVPASALTIGGLVKHLTATERWWFSLDFARLDIAPPWDDDDPDPLAGFGLDADDHIDAIIAEYLAECDRSRAAIHGHALDEMAMGDDMHFNLRFALTHMVEETARHCGHLDLLRESIDGLRGQ